MASSRLAIVMLLAAACGDGGGESADGGSDAAPSLDAPPSSDAAPLIDATADSASSGDAATSLQIAGTLFEVGGAMTPAQGKVVIVWFVTGDGPLYKFGEGTSSEAQFTVTLDTVPPTGALIGGSLGIAHAVLVPLDFEVAEGVIVDQRALEAVILGISGQHAVIYRTDPVSGGWTDAFPSGYACGECVPAQGGGFDTWTPVDCADVQIEVRDGGGFDVCNWT